MLSQTGQEQLSQLLAELPRRQEGLREAAAAYARAKARFDAGRCDVSRPVVTDEERYMLMSIGRIRDRIEAIEREIEFLEGLR